MAKIKSIEYFSVKPRWVFLKVVDEDGYTGWGEATLEGHTRAIEGALDEMIEPLLGAEAKYVDASLSFKVKNLGTDMRCLSSNIEHIWQTVWRHGFYRGGPVFMSALAGIDIALWDLKGQRLKAPVHQLLGGAVREKVKVYAWIGGDKPSDVVDAA